MQTEPVRGWGEVLMASLTNALTVMANAIPKIIAFLLILLVGWIIARLLARGTRALLSAAKFDNLAGRAGFDRLTQKLGSDAAASELAGATVKWIILLVTFLVAFEALGLPEVSNLFQALLLWVPNLIVAMAVLFLAGLAARPLGNLARGVAAEADFSDPDAIARAARIALWVFAVIVALTQLRVAENLIYALFYGFVAAVALAFGLGARETTARIVERWYRTAEQKWGGSSPPAPGGAGREGF